jgi:4-hydroxy-4-methyl-2-oxoglutarate aldolase
VDRRLRPAWPGASVAAPAYPVGCAPGDNLAVHVAVTKAPRGSVLVVDVGQVADRGYWGEVLTTAAEAAGLAGLVLDGGVRDVAALEAHGFPVFSSAVALTGATKDKPGTIGVPVRVGGVPVSVGDWVVADVDGVTFVPGVWPPGAPARPRRRASSRRCAPGRRRWTSSGSTRHWCARATPGRPRSDAWAGGAIRPLARPFIRSDLSV